MTRIGIVVRKQVAAVMRRFRLGNDFLAILVPHNAKGSSDAVKALAPGIMKRVGRPPKLLLLDQAVERVQIAFQKAGLPGVPPRLAIFAHPSDGENGFAVNPGQDVRYDSLSPEWWQGPDHHYEFVYAHVCNGASVLSRDPWIKVFPRWVSYEVPVEVFIGTPRSEELWIDLSTNLLLGAWNSENVEGLFFRLRGIYEESLARLNDTFDHAGGDAITMVLLEKSISALAKRSS